VDRGSDRGGTRRDGHHSAELSRPAGHTILFQVAAPETERLDRFLADQLSLSRTQAARLVAEGAVQVNEQVARASRTLAREDLVRVTLPGAAPPRSIAPLSLALSVVFEDEFLLVIDKPAGLVVHPAPGHWEDTLVNALAARGTLSGRGERSGIVHRLDRDTSGLLIIAKTDAAHRKLSHALSLRRIERTYAALAWGHLDGAREVDAPIARNPKDRKRMGVVAGGRHALTVVTPVARYRACDLVRATLATGRTHQIRVHLAHVGHPVVGDPVYGGGGARRVSGSARGAADQLERVTPRQALHAARLAFAHPETRDWLTFASDWPADLRPALAAAAEDESLLARPHVLEYLGFLK
jgi:23S rRNA pseudouridine1911/1915/1917 synthase